MFEIATWIRLLSATQKEGNTRAQSSVDYREEKAKLEGERKKKTKENREKDQKRVRRRAKKETKRNRENSKAHNNLTRCVCGSLRLWSVENFCQNPLKTNENPGGS
jgi:hypothetical protein